MGKVEAVVERLIPVATGAPMFQFNDPARRCKDRPVCSPQMIQVEGNRKEPQGFLDPDPIAPCHRHIPGLLFLSVRKLGKLPFNLTQPEMNAPQHEYGKDPDRDERKQIQVTHCAFSVFQSVVEFSRLIRDSGCVSGI